MATTRQKPTRSRSSKADVQEEEIEAEEIEEEQEAEEAEEDGNGKKPARSATEVRYTLFTEDEDGNLSPLGDYPGRNAKEAVKSYAKDTEQDGPIEVVVVPLRNMTRISVTVETKQRLKFE